MSIRVRIIDDEVLSNIDRYKLRAYLGRTGWMYIGETPNMGEWFEKFAGEQCYEIMVPFEGMRDYKYRMYEMFQVLEEIENRSQLDIWEDLKK